MKERTSFISKVKQVYQKHEEAIDGAIGIVILVAAFITGFLVSWNCCLKPLNDEQFELCEEVARNVFEQKEPIIVEVPKLENEEEFHVDITTTKIVVQYGSRSGKVTATLQNGELVMSRDKEMVKAIPLSIVIGMFFTMVVIYAILIIAELVSWIRRR